MKKLFLLWFMGAFLFYFSCFSQANIHIEKQHLDSFQSNNANAKKNKDLSDKSNVESSLSLISIKNVSDIEPFIQHGDWLFIDIDDTILRTGNKRYDNQSSILNIDPKAPLMIKFLKEKSLHLQESNRAIRVFALTARSEKSKEATLKQLKDLGYEFDDVIFAPYKEEKNISEKGEAILEILSRTPSHQHPKRILCIDDLPENLENIGTALKNTKIALKLYQKQTNIKLYGDSDFPSNILKLSIVEDFSTHQQNTCKYKVKDKKNHIYILEGLATPSEMKTHILLSSLYNSLGIRVPKFAVYDHLPEKLKAYCGSPGPFKLTQFIPSQDHQNSPVLEKEMQRTFVTDAFFNNLDLLHDVYGNIILDTDDKLWRIPSNSLTEILRHNSSRELNLETLKEKQAFYKTISKEQILQQVHELLQKSPLLWKTIDEVDKNLHLENAQNLKGILLDRLHNLAQTYGVPQKSHQGRVLKDDLADPDLKPSKNSGAGILVYSQDPDTKEPVMFLAKRGFEKSWGTLGGKSDNSDSSFAETASREVLEESIGLFKFRTEDVRDFSSHDLVSKSGTFRLYTGHHKYIPLENLKAALKNADDRHQKEHTDFMWIPVKELLEFLKKEPISEPNGNIKLGKITLFGPLYEMLMEPAVKDTLKKISLKMKPKLLHTKTGFNPDISTKYGSVGDTNEKIVPLGRTADGKIISSRKYGNSDEYIYHDPQKEKDHLIKAIASHGSAIAELKQKMTQHKPEKINQKGNENFKYSQTDAYLKLVLQTNQDLRELESNEVVKLFLKKSKFKTISQSNDQDYENILTEVLESERQKKGSYVFYHYTDSEKAFYSDITSAFRTLLQLKAPGKLILLRGLDKYFLPFATVHDVITKFKDAAGEVSNYRGDYQQVGLSVNPFLFGSDGQRGECSYYLFFSEKSSAESVGINPSKDVPMFNILLSKFLFSIGSNKGIDRYHDLYNRYFQDGKNTRLFQIFISPEVINQVAYISIAGGNLWHFYLDKNKNELETDTVLKSIRNNPDIFYTIAKNSENRKNTKNIDAFQARLFMKPEIFHNQKLVQIKSYWRFPLSKEDQKKYEQELQKLVSEDVEMFLKNQNTLDPEILSGKKTKLQQVHDRIFEGSTGAKRVVDEEDISRTTFAFLAQEDEQKLFEELINEYPDILLKKVSAADYGFSLKAPQDIYFLKKNSWETIKQFSKFNEIPSLLLFALHEEDTESIKKFSASSFNKIYKLIFKKGVQKEYSPLSYVVEYFNWPEAKSLIFSLIELGADASQKSLDLLGIALKSLQKATSLDETDRYLIALLSKVRLSQNDRDVGPKRNDGNIVTNLFSGKNPLGYAMQMSNTNTALEIGKILIRSGFDPNLKENGSSLLHIAQDKNIKFVEMLIKEGVDVNIKDKRGKTPLFTAVQYGYEKLINLLIKNNANINAKDRSGQTVLSEILNTIAKKPVVTSKLIRTAAFLIKNGATVNFKCQAPLLQIMKDVKKAKELNRLFKREGIEAVLSENGKRVDVQINSTIPNAQNDTSSSLEENIVS